MLQLFLFLFSLAFAGGRGFDIAADSGVCGIVPLGTGHGVRCAGEAGEPVIIDGSEDGYYPRRMVTLSTTTEVCAPWDDGDDAVWSISYDGVAAASMCGLVCTYDSCAVRVGSDCSLPTRVVSWGENSSAGTLAHGDNTAGETAPDFVVDEAGEPILATNIDAHHGSWVAVVGGSQQIGGWGEDCGFSSMDCGGLPVVGDNNWLPVSDAGAFALVETVPVIDRVWTIGSASIARTTVNGTLDGYFVTGTSDGDRRETLQPTNNPAEADFASYTPGIYADGVEVTTVTFDFMGGGNEQWCAIDTDGNYWNGGDSRGENYSLFEVVTADGRELRQMYSSVGGTLPLATSCAAGDKTQFFVTDDGTLHVAGKNTAYAMTDDHGESYKTTGDTIPVPSGYWGWSWVTAQAYGACALALVQQVDDVGDVYCWGGMGSSALGTYDYGDQPILFIEGVVRY